MSQGQYCVIDRYVRDVGCAGTTRCERHMSVFLHTATKEMWVILIGALMGPRKENVGRWGN